MQRLRGTGIEMVSVKLQLRSARLRQELQSKERCRMSWEDCSSTIQLKRPLVTQPQDFQLQRELEMKRPVTSMANASSQQTELFA